MGRIFISYRRKDSAYVTGRIYDRLQSQFPRDLVFKDVDAIPRAANFREVIASAIAECDVLLAVIGNGWLSAKNSHVQPRLSDPDDPVRAELEMALKRNVPIIPLLLDDMEMPSKQLLPDALRPLADLNALQVHPDPYFNQDMQRLVRDINQILKKRKGTFRERSSPLLFQFGKPSLKLLTFIALTIGVVGVFIAAMINTTRMDSPAPRNSTDAIIPTEGQNSAVIPEAPIARTTSAPPLYGEESEPNDLIGNANHIALRTRMAGKSRKTTSSTSSRSSRQNRPVKSEWSFDKHTPTVSGCESCSTTVRVRKSTPRQSTITRLHRT